MKNLFFSFLFFLTNALYAQPLTDAERLARLYSKDMEPALATLLANSFGVRDPEISKVVIEELTGAINSFYASEYEKRINATDLKDLNQILNTDAGKALLKANADLALKIFQEPGTLRSLLIASCVRSKQRLNAAQASVVAPLCK